MSFFFKYLFTLSLVLWLVEPLNAQEFLFKHYTIEDGLSQNTVWCILQDHQGFLWFGTSDGLNRFDGYNFKVFKTKESDPSSIGNSYIWSLMEDDDHTIWVGTDKGVYLYDPDTERFKKFTLKTSNNIQIENTVSKIIKDKKGNFWISTISQGVFVYSPKKAELKVYQNDPDNKWSLSSNFVWTLYVDSKGTVWAGTQMGGLNRFVPEKNGFVRYTRDPALDKFHDIDAYSILEDSRGRFWVGTWLDGICQMDRDHERFVHDFPLLPSLLPCAGVKALFEYHPGQLFIGTENGLFYYDVDYRKSVPIYNDITSARSLSNNAITSIARDREGGVWIGTRSGGINYLPPQGKPFENYAPNSKPASLKGQIIKKFCEDARGNIWIATEDAGLNYWDKQRNVFENYQPNKSKNSLSDINIRTILLDGDKLYVGTFTGGLNIMDVRTKSVEVFKKTSSPNSLCNNFVIDVFKDSRGRVWVGTIAGLTVFDPKTKQFSLVNDLGLGAFWIEDIWEDAMGMIWLTTQFEGLFKFDPKTNKWVNYKHSPKNPNFVADAKFICIHQDRQNRLWFGTQGKGLCVYRPATDDFVWFSEKDGLPSNTIYGILDDKHNNLWLSTNAGLVKFNPKTLFVKTYKKNDGLQGDQFNFKSFFMSKSGQFYFGGHNGFNVFEPDLVKENTYKPSVAITGFQLFNKEVSVGGSNSPLTKSISQLKDLVLSYDQSIFSFEFAGLSYVVPKNNRYAYKLEPFEKDWNYTDRRRVSYTSLHEGNYVLRIKASNNDGVWNEKEACLYIRILPPFWRTWWFRLIYGIAILVSLFTLYYARVDVLHRQKMELAKKVKFRTAELEEANNQLAMRQQEILSSNEQIVAMNNHLESKNVEIEKQKEEIEHQRDQLLVLNKTVKETSYLRMQFFINISHEFRTPLTLILAPVETLLANWSGNERDLKLLKSIKRNSQRLLHLINELMDFQRIENKKMDMKFSKADLVLFIDELARSFSELASQRRINYSVLSADQQVETWFDAEKVEKILYNLISNAIKFTKPNGTVKVSSLVVTIDELPDYNDGEVCFGRFKPKARYLEIKVSDTGIGIPPEHLKNIFKKFYRVQSPEVSAIGTGIGLSLANDLVKIHSGVISVRSQPNVGSLFTVWLPIDRIPTDGKEIQQIGDDRYDYSKGQVGFLKEQLSELQQISSPQPLVGSFSHSPMKTILVVEDNPELRHFIVDQLSAEFTVCEASNGREALEKAEATGFDLILSDIMMPEMDGIELCRRLKNDLSTSHLPVVLLTARSSVESQIEGWVNGADDFIPKPFDVSALKIRIQNIIDSRAKLRMAFHLQQDFKPNQLSANTHDQDFLVRAYELVNRNIDNPSFSAKEFAEGLNISYSLLHKKMISLTDESALDFILSIRMKRAADLLKNKAISIFEVASQTGFNDPKYFSRCFKKFYGKTPTEFMEQIG